MKNTFLRSKYLKIIGTAVKEYGFSPINGWIEGLLTIENNGLTQIDISEKLTEIMNNVDFPTSLTSVNRALKSMELNNLIIKKGTRKEGYIYYLNKFSDIPVGFIQKVLAVNTKNLKDLQDLKEEIVKSDDKSLLDGIEIEINFSNTVIKYFRQ